MLMHGWAYYPTISSWSNESTFITSSDLKQKTFFAFGTAVCKWQIFKRLLAFISIALNFSAFGPFPWLWLNHLLSHSQKFWKFSCLTRVPLILHLQTFLAFLYVPYPLVKIATFELSKPVLPTRAQLLCLFRGKQKSKASAQVNIFAV